MDGIGKALPDQIYEPELSVESIKPCNCFLRPNCNSNMPYRPLMYASWIIGSAFVSAKFTRAASP